MDNCYAARKFSLLPQWIPIISASEGHTQENYYDNNVSILAFFFLQKCLTTLHVQQSLNKMPPWDPEFINFKNITYEPWPLWFIKYVIRCFENRMKRRKKMYAPSRQNIADILNNNETQELNPFGMSKNRYLIC